ncbi:MAG: PEP-CTERM sorting domain-containing protein [Planctomycetota bacterium]
MAALLGDAASSGFSTTGVTDGSSSIEITTAPVVVGDTATFLIEFALTEEIIAALQVDPVILYDITLGADPDPTDGVTGGGAFESTFSTDGGFATTAGGFFNEFVSYGDSETVVATLDPGVVDALDSSLANGTVAVFQLNFNVLVEDTTDPTNATVFFDNVRTQSSVVIPEPASLGLLGMAGLGLMRRRK